MPDITPPDDTALGTQSAALEVGLRVFRQYVLKRFLSRGPLGSAWLVVHEGIGRELAMRFLPESWLLDEQVISRLREVVVKLLEITHPGIVGILDFVRDGQAAAIVSRYVEAESAVDTKALQPQRCFEVDKLRPWLGQMCDALDFAWRRHHAFHGDLCPANLLITPLGDVKVADFGLTRSLYDLTGPTGDPLLAMPPAFCSPERLRGEPVTVADDVHNFGAIVFDLLTSKPPFPQGRTAGEAVPAMAQRRTELGIGGDLIPPEWEEVIAACLAEQPGDRPRSLREAGERLGVIAPLPADADRTPQPTVLPRPHETVVESRPPSTRPAGPTPVFPTSEMTAAMEPPTMSGTPPPAEPPAAEVEQEPVPATVDENLGYEETIAGGSPPYPSTPPGDDASATIAAEPEPAPFVPPPPSQPQPAGDDASATVAAEEPKTEEPIAMEDLERTVAQPPVPPPAPAVSPKLEESVSMPAAVRRPAAATQPLADVPAQAPAIPARRFPMWAIPAAIVLIAVIVAPLTLRKNEPAAATPEPVAPPPTATPEQTPMPTPPPTPAPTPMPATPQPMPAIRTVAAEDLAALADTGPIREPLLLMGSFRISATIPGRPGLAGSAVMRPSNGALSGQIRVNVTLAPATTVPVEGSEITLGSEGKYIVREVRRGGDGQLNVTVQQAP